MEKEPQPKPIDVLWVIDNPVKRESIKTTLENCIKGKVIFTNSPPAALELLTNQESPFPDLVVIELPDPQMVKGLIYSLRYHQDDSLKKMPICCLDSTLPEAERKEWEKNRVIFPEGINFSQPAALRKACAGIL